MAKREGTRFAMIKSYNKSGKYLGSLVWFYFFIFHLISHKNVRHPMHHKTVFSFLMESVGQKEIVDNIPMNKQKDKKVTFQKTCYTGLNRHSLGYKM